MDRKAGGDDDKDKKPEIGTDFGLKTDQFDRRNAAGVFAVKKARTKGKKTIANMIRGQWAAGWGVIIL